MVVLPGSMSYNIWKDTPVPLTLSFYIFNITNPEEFQRGAKPNFTELGPYVYQWVLKPIFFPVYYVNWKRWRS